ncbi:MAG: NAD(P)/FAD-dependent oxidoreductase [Spirochaetia bacterium]|nr:NAD(P)/FAD-dependent oxidoreductase [Spirochaetia bacterium]
MNKNEKIYDAVVVGGGLGGLIAGAKLAKEGKKVLLLEQHNIPGGCATTYKYKKYKMEVGLHEMDGLDSYDMKNTIFQDLNVFENVKFIKVPEFYRFLQGSLDIRIPHCVNEAKEILQNNFTDETRAVDHFFKTILGIRNDITNLPREKWKMLFLLPVFPLKFKHLAKHFNSNLGDFLDSITENEKLKIVLSANLQYYHDDPYTMSLVFFSVAQASFYTGGGHFIQGGSQVLSNFLSDLIQNNGGEVKLNHLAKKIIIEKGKAIGVEYIHKTKKEPEIIRAYGRSIIANSSVPYVSKKLLSEDESRSLRNKVKEFVNSSSILTMYIRFHTPPSSVGNPCYSTFFFDEKIKTLKDLAAFQKSDFSTRLMGFVDYSLIDSGLTSEGSVGAVAAMDEYDDWKSLSKEDYKRKKEETAEILIDRLEKSIPGIKGCIEGYELGTPLTIERYTLNDRGSPYGYAQIPSQSAMKRLQTCPGIKNLFFASAWGMPGGGFTGAILSGYNCAETILKKP